MVTFLEFDVVISVGGQVSICVTNIAHFFVIFSPLLSILKLLYPILKCEVAIFPNVFTKISLKTS